MEDDDGRRAELRDSRPWELRGFVDGGCGAGVGVAWRSEAELLGESGSLPASDEVFAIPLVDLGRIGGVAGGRRGVAYIVWVIDPGW